METKINIAAILKGKPQGIRLYSPIFGECAFCLVQEETDDICVKKHNGEKAFFCSEGLYCTLGEVMLYPSREMRDWSKFAWKKGDVLISNDGKKEVFFNGFTDDTYSLFKAEHGFEILSDGNTIYLADEDGIATSDYTLETEEAAKTYINTIEERLGGKLNRETLEVEKAQPDFKDGDMVSLEIRYIDSEDVIIETYIVHGDYNYGEKLNFYTGCNNLGMIKHDSCVKPTNTSVRNVFIRYATDSEKQQLFSALAKENKAWDSEKKEFVDLKPKIELKPFDKVLVRDAGDEIWEPAFFFRNLSHFGGYNYQTVGGEWRFYCIPYIGNESLLGTTKDVEG